MTPRAACRRRRSARRAARQSGGAGRGRATVLCRCARKARAWTCRSASGRSAWRRWPQQRGVCVRLQRAPAAGQSRRNPRGVRGQPARCAGAQARPRRGHGFQGGDDPLQAEMAIGSAIKAATTTASASASWTSGCSSWKRSKGPPEPGSRRGQAEKTRPPGTSPPKSAPRWKSTCAHCKKLDHVEADHAAAANAWPRWPTPSASTCNWTRPRRR